MLKIIVPGIELFDDERQVFITEDESVLELEHSLVSLSKWEETWEKPFLGDAKKTPEEILGYVQAMCVTPDVSPEVFRRLTEENVQAINNYVDAKMTATWFSSATGSAPSREIITSEIIYHWMFALKVPMECQNWHLSKLFTLIKVINEKRNPPKKMTQREIMEQNRRLNAQRRAELKTSG